MGLTEKDEPERRRPLPGQMELPFGDDEYVEYEDDGEPDDDDGLVFVPFDDDGKEDA